MSEPIGTRTQHESLTPSSWVVRWSRHIAPTARVLDFAAGRGRNVAALLARGARVAAADRDAGALSGLDPSVERIVVDLERDPWPFAQRSFDAVVVCNYLHRPRLDLLAGLLAPGGLLIAETFGTGNAAYGRPSSPAFLLRPGESFDWCRRAGLQVLAYERGYVDAPRPAIVERVCAARPPFDAERYALVG